MSAPFAGLRVLDLTRLWPGAFCTLMLADLGADVVKVEAPEGGDYARATPPLIDGMSAFFHASNRNKRSIILDLKSDNGRAALHRLVAKADVLVEGFRPGVMARLGCDYKTLKAINPRLIYCAISGWGQTGAYADLASHDLNFGAVSGLIGEMETPQPLGGQVVDVTAGYAAFGAIAAALFRRAQTGEGAFVDTSMFESVIPVVSYPWVEAALQERGVENVPRGLLSGRYACYNVYRSQDRVPVALAAFEQHFWANFCNAVDRPDLIPYHQVPERQRYLLAELEEIFAMHTANEWDTRLIPASCCYSRVNTLHSLLTDPQVRDRDLLAVNADGVPYMRMPLRIDHENAARGRAPGHGEHTVDVLREAGFSDDEISRLAALQF